MHASAGFTVKSTWLKAIKNGNFKSWPGLTYNNAAKYCTNSVDTLKGHMVKSSQGVRSTNKKKNQKQNNENKTPQGTIQQQSDTADIPSHQKTQELHIWDHPISKLYTGDCGQFPIILISGN